MPTLTAPADPGGALSLTAHPLAHANAGRLVLTRYASPAGERTVCARRGPQGTVLVLDEDAAMLDRRLVAHLCADEPASNAALTAQRYLADPRRAARALSDLDWVLAPEPPPTTPQPDVSETLITASGERFRIVEVAGYGPRWVHRAPGERGERVVVVRRVVGELEAYGAVRAMTSTAIAASRSPSILRRELATVEHSRRVLNRGLRVAVLARVATGELTLSRDRAALRTTQARGGHCPGDTAWLRRRIGDTPEAGADRPTPWISSELLGRIARDGLHLAPREVELA